MINAVIYSRVSSDSERQDTQRQTTELKEYTKTRKEELTVTYPREELSKVFRKVLMNSMENMDYNIMVTMLYTSQYQ